MLCQDIDHLALGSTNLELIDLSASQIKVVGSVSIVRLQKGLGSARPGCATKAATHDDLGLEEPESQLSFTSFFSRFWRRVRLN